MNTWLALVFIGVAPWTPAYGGHPPVSWAISSGGQNQDRLILLASAHWGLRRRKVRFIPDAQVWHPSCRSLAPPYPLCPFGTSPLDKGSRPLPTKPASLGFGGDPN